MIIIARNFGQLGNRLILSAHLIAAAREYNVTLANPCFAEYADFFESTAHDLWCRYPALPAAVSTSLRAPLARSSTAPSPAARRHLARSVYLAARSACHLRLTRWPANVIRLKSNQVCDLREPSFAEKARSSRLLLLLGWQFRSDSLMQQHADAIRDHFRPMPHHRQNVRQVIDPLRGEADVIVGVHVRHGDYANFQNGRYYYSVAQYASAMRRIADQLPGKRVSFLVCGNGVMTRRDFGELDVHFGPGHMVEDMYAFAETDLIIGPPSTFTGWAAFYGQTRRLVMETADANLDAIDLSGIQTPSAAA